MIVEEAEARIIHELHEGGTKGRLEAEGPLTTDQRR